MAHNVYGIDFGTENIKIYDGTEMSIISEKEIIAIKDKDKIIGIGDKAYEMYEKTPDNIQAIFPIQYGVIANLKCMQYLFENFFKNITSKRSKIGRFCIAVPTDITEVEKKAFYDVVAKSEVRSREIKIVEKPIADAVALGFDMTSSRGNMIVNIGADTTEISVISHGGIVISRIIQIGGNKLNQILCDVVKRKYNILIGMKTAEKIKLELADAMYDEDAMTDDELDDSIIYVYGRNVITGLPSERGVTSDNIYDATREFYNEIVDAIKDTLERTPPELTSDIKEVGLYLTGGSSLIKNLDKFVSKEVGVRVSTTTSPFESVIRGVSMIVSDPKYRNLMYEPTDSSF